MLSCYPISFNYKTTIFSPAFLVFWILVIAVFQCSYFFALSAHDVMTVPHSLLRQGQHHRYSDTIWLSSTELSACQQYELLVESFVWPISFWSVQSRYILPRPSPGIVHLIQREPSDQCLYIWTSYSCQFQKYLIWELWSLTFWQTYVLSRRIFHTRTVKIILPENRTYWIKI